MYVCMYVYACVCMYTCMYVYACLFMYVCVYVYACVCMCEIGIMIVPTFFSSYLMTSVGGLGPTRHELYQELLVTTVTEVSPTFPQCVVDLEIAER